jgi:hypothetical protein
MNAFRVFEADQSLLLPRVHCFFMNILARTFGDHKGERLAISDFNTSHEMRKISKIYGLQYYLSPPRPDEDTWNNFIWPIFSIMNCMGATIASSEKPLEILQMNRPDPALRFRFGGV